MKNTARKLTPKKISILTRKLSPVLIHVDCDLIYERHVPNFVIILLEGKGIFTLRNKEISVIEPFTVLGHVELHANSKVRFGCRFRANSRVIVIGKSCLSKFPFLLSP